MLRMILPILLALVAITSCKKSYDPPVFKSVEDIQLSGVKDGRVNMKANAILYNPNDVSAKLKHIDINVYIKGKKVAQMEKSYSLKIDPLSNFSLPMEVGLDISELGLINSILGFIQGQEYEAHYVGKAKIIVHGIPVSIPINYYDKLKLR